MSNFNWSNQTTPDDKKEERTIYFFCVPPAAKMMSLILFKNGQYQASCLGNTKRFEKMNLNTAKREAVIWLMNLLRNIQFKLYEYIDEIPNLKSP